MTKTSTLLARRPPLSGSFSSHAVSRAHLLIQSLARVRDAREVRRLHLHHDLRLHGGVAADAIVVERVDVGRAEDRVGLCEGDGVRLTARVRIRSLNQGGRDGRTKAEDRDQPAAGKHAFSAHAA